MRHDISSLYTSNSQHCVRALQTINGLQIWLSVMQLAVDVISSLFVTRITLVVAVKRYLGDTPRLRELIFILILTRKPAPAFTRWACYLPAADITLPRLILPFQQTVNAILDANRIRTLPWIWHRKRA